MRAIRPGAAVASASTRVRLAALLLLVILAGACSSGEAASVAAERSPDPAASPPTPEPTASPTTGAAPDPTAEPATQATAQSGAPDDDSSSAGSFETRPLGVGALGIKGDWSKLDVDGPYLDTLGSFGGFFEVSWCRIEEEPGTQNWNRLDRVVSDAAAHDIALLIKIRVGSCWATDGVASDARGERERRASAFPADMASYDEFVTTLVTRYLDSAVVAYAIENEVNGEGFWAGTVDEFVELTEAGAAAVRAADPAAFIMDSGLSSTTYGAAMAADLLDRGEPERAIEVFNTYYERRTRRRDDFPVVTSVSELEAVLSSGQAARNIAYAAASTALAQRGVVDGYQLHFYERYVSIPVLMEYVNRSVGGVPVHVVEAGIFWQNGDQDALLDETLLLVAGLLEHGASSVTFLPLRSNGEGIRWGLLDPQGDTPRRAQVFAQLSQALQGPNPRVGVLDRDSGTAVILGSDSGAVAVVTDTGGAATGALDVRVDIVEGATPEVLAADLG